MTATSAHRGRLALVLAITGTVCVAEVVGGLLSLAVAAVGALALAEIRQACISQGRSGQVLDRLSDCLRGHFDVEHRTFQLEPVGHQDHEPISHA
jgi:hypothetical protein